MAYELPEHGLTLQHVYHVSALIDGLLPINPLTLSVLILFLCAEDNKTIFSHHSRSENITVAYYSEMTCNLKTITNYTW